jgi:hypothetical protein
MRVQALLLRILMLLDYGTTAELNAQTGTGQFSYQNLIIGQNADMLVIDHSVNDILNKLPQAFTGNINSTDRSTLYGAYNTIIQAAIADKPSIEIVIVVLTSLQHPKLSKCNYC